MANHNTLAEAARALVAANAQGLLSTLSSADGYPYGSLVEYLALADGDLVMLLSDLAEHSKYLAADPRASLLVAPSLGIADALAAERVALLGQATRVADKHEFAQAYLERHPKAAAYIDFADCRFYRLKVERVRYIAGFGRMGWVGGDAYAGAGADEK